MKYLFILFGAIIISTSCARKEVSFYTKYTITEEELSKLKLASFFAKNIDDWDRPLNIVNEIDLSTDSVFYVCNLWKNLDSHRQYYLKIEMYSPFNQKIYSQNTLFTKRTLIDDIQYVPFFLMRCEKYSINATYTLVFYLNNLRIREMEITIKNL